MAVADCSCLADDLLDRRIVNASGAEPQLWDRAAIGKGEGLG